MLSFYGTILGTICLPCYQLSCHYCFHLAIVFKSVASNILLQRSIRMKIARHHIRTECGTCQGSSSTDLHFIYAYFLTYFRSNIRILFGPVKNIFTSVSFWSSSYLIPERCGSYNMYINQQDAQNSCVHRASSYNMYINQQDAQNSYMRRASSYNMYVNQQDAQKSCE